MMVHSKLMDPASFHTKHMFQQSIGCSLKKALLYIKFCPHWALSRQDENLRVNGW